MRHWHLLRDWARRLVNDGKNELAGRLDVFGLHMLCSVQADSPARPGDLIRCYCKLNDLHDLELITSLVLLCKAASGAV